MANQKRVLLLCGDYVEDYEVMVPFQALLAYGLAVDAVCPGKKSGDICRTAVHQLSGHQTYSESRGHNFAVNATFDEIEATKYDGLFIPGGRAPEYLAMNEAVLDLVKSFANTKKPIVSVCHGQLILAAADVVRGRKCTAYPAVKPVLVAAGAHWEEPETLASCTIDGNLITGSTYEGNPDFIRLFVKALGGSIVGSGKRILFLCGAIAKRLLPLNERLTISTVLSYRITDLNLLRNVISKVSLEDDIWLLYPPCSLWSRVAVLVILLEDCFFGS